MNIVVIGGSAAGMAAAAKAKRTNPLANVIVFEKTNYVSYAPCGIPYLFMGLIHEFNKLVYYTKEYFIEKRKIDVKTRHEVVEIDVSGKSVTAINLDTGKEIVANYDKLILATGGVINKPNIKGIDLDGIHSLRTLEDGKRLYKASFKSKVIGIIGAGYTGLEMAEAFIKMGKKVYLFQRRDHVVRTMDPEITKYIENELVKNRINLQLGEEVVELKGKDRVMKIITNKGEYNVDLVLLSTGVKPNTKLVSKIGLKIGVTGGIKVNEYMMTNIKDVYAAGDNVETINLVNNKPVYFPSAPVANKMGRVAGDNAAGGNSSFPGIVGTIIFKVFNLHIGRTGLSSREALESGFNVVTEQITHVSRSHYYPGYKELHVRLIVDKDTHRILGGQIVGYEGVVGRINTLAAIVTAGMGIEDLSMLDLGYAPPFAPVWDPLIVAANIISRKIRK